jgi:fibronectin-binding autotransporter adhesin
MHSIPAEFLFRHPFTHPFHGPKFRKSSIMKLRIPTTARLSFPLASALAALLAAPTVHADSYYWDIDGATAGAGGTAPAGSWTTGGTTWSTSPNGSVATVAATTAASDDLFFSAGVDATGAYTITLNDAQNAGSLTFQDGTATISGAGGVINLGGTGIINVTNSLLVVPNSAVIGANTDTIISGAAGLTKTGVGTLTLSSTAANTFTGGLNVNGGTLNLNFANLATPTDIVNSANALAFGGGALAITGKNTDTSTQTLGNVTVNSGGGQLLGNSNGGTALNITLGTLTTTAAGGSLLVGTSVGGTAPAITTTTDKDAQGIYGGRVAFSNGTANTGYDWATTVDGASPFAFSAYSGYTALDTATVGNVTDTNNSRITAGAILPASSNRTTNSLKFENPASAQILDLGGNTLTVSSGGILITGNTVTQAPRISNGILTAGAGSNYDLVIHQYNATVAGAGSTRNNTNIYATIADNGANPVRLVKAGTGSLLLSSSSANTFTGGIVINGGTFGWTDATGANALNNNSLTFNANTIVLANETATTNGGITLNNGSQVEFRNNTKTFTVNGPVTGAGGGITLGQNGGGATNLNFNSTANNFTGPVRFAVTAQSGNLTVNSFADSSGLGEGNITFGVSGTVAHNFNYGSGAIAPLTLNNRRFDLAGTQAAMSINNNSPQAFTINTGLLVSGTGTKTLTLGGTGAGLSTFAGDIGLGSATTLNITKAGSGTWALGGANSYNGTTTVSAGTLLINGNQSTATGAVAVNGTSTLGGSGTTGGTITVAAGAKLAPGNAGVGTLATGGGLNISAMAGGAGTLVYELNSTAASDKITVAGTLSIGSGTLGLGDFAFTNLGGMSAGTYKLITGASPVSGTLDAANTTGTLDDFDLELAINGNDIELVVTGGPDNDFTDWAATFLPTVIGSPLDDHDGDGLSNDEERAFGLNPTSGSSSNPISVPLDPTNGTFTFTRRDPTVSGLTYQVWTSTDLADWEVDGGAVFTPGTVVDQVEPVAVQLSAGLLSEPKLFFRITYAEPVPAPPLLSVDFEANNGGFTVVTLGGTPWAHGAPNSPSQGGGAITSGAGGSTQCWGTNLTGGYTASTDTSLRSPVIDLTSVTAATLSFAQAIDSNSGHTLEVNVIDDTTDTVIANIIPAAQDGNASVSPWETVAPVALPGAAYGQAVRIEWRFIGNGDGTYNGAYIDDVTVLATP